MKKLSIFLIFLLLITAGCVSDTKESESGLDLGCSEAKKGADGDQVKDESDAQGNSANNDKVDGITNTTEQAAQMPDLEFNPYKYKDLVSVYSEAVLKTNKGDIKVSFYKESPFTVNNFLNLAKKDFYNETTFHRVIKDFMIQGGDPNSKDDDPTNDGQGGPGYYFQDEFNDHKLVEGSLAMANAGPNTNGSQFFIVTSSSTPWLDGKHVNFGQVIEGIDVVKEIEGVEIGENDRPKEDVKIVSIELVKSSGVKSKKLESEIE